MLQEAGLVGPLAALRRDALLDEDRVTRPSETTVGRELKGLVLGGGGVGVTQGAFSSFECRAFFDTCTQIRTCVSMLAQQLCIICSNNWTVLAYENYMSTVPVPLTPPHVWL